MSSNPIETKKEWYCETCWRTDCDCPKCAHGDDDAFCECCEDEE
jgi:hypothetical protein